MPQIDSWPPFSSFELERQAAIERNLFIQDCGRAAVRWLRLLALRSVRFARRVAVERQRRKAIRQLKELDDRTLRDLGIHRGEIEFAVRCGVPARERRTLREERRNIAPPQRRAA